jgi:hypothetical protein
MIKNKPELRRSGWGTAVVPAWLQPEPSRLLNASGVFI